MKAWERATILPSWSATLLLFALRRCYVIMLGTRIPRGRSRSVNQRVAGQWKSAERKKTVPLGFPLLASPAEEL